MSIFRSSDLPTTGVDLAAPAGNAPRIAVSHGSEYSVPLQVQSWYLVCRSADVRPGTVLTREFLGRPIVIFRGQSGTVHALAAHCAHMGAHLGRGTVVGDHLRCPLHHWQYDGQGVCRHAPGMAAAPLNVRQFAYPVAERYGGVFLFNGPAPLFPPPAFRSVAETELRVGHGRPVRLRCPWFAVAANGFDLQHLETVHHRVLREPPSVELLDPYRLQFRYVSRVVGHSLADRTVRWLSRDRVVVTVICWGGSVMTVESTLGRARSTLLLSLMPVPGGTEVIPIVGVRRGRAAVADALRGLVSRWLFLTFLRHDVAILNDMHFAPRLPLQGNEPLQRYLEFLDGLPSASE